MIVSDSSPRLIVSPTHPCSGSSNDTLSFCFIRDPRRPIPSSSDKAMSSCATRGTNLLADRKQTPVNLTKPRRQVLRDHSRPGGRGSFAVDPNRGGCGLEGRHALGEEAGSKSGQHVAA